MASVRIWYNLNFDLLIVNQAVEVVQRGLRKDIRNFWVLKPRQFEASQKEVTYAQQEAGAGLGSIRWAVYVR